MTDRIEPAMTAGEWADQEAVRLEGTARWPIRFSQHGEPRLHIAITAAEHFDASKPATLATLIAACNAALPDSDPRKITRETVEMLRDAARRCDDTTEPGFAHLAGDLGALADALESYLPPE